MLDMNKEHFDAVEKARGEVASYISIVEELTKEVKDITEKCRNKTALLEAYTEILKEKSAALKKLSEGT